MPKSTFFSGGEEGGGSDPSVAFTQAPLLVVPFSTPGGAHPLIPLSFSLANILPQEPKNFDFSSGAEGVIKLTTLNL